MKVAAIDMGTNTFLCLIAEKSQEQITVKKDLYRVVRLGEGVAQNKHFTPQALARAKECLEWFCQEIQAEGVNKVLAAATAAARDVDNSGEIRHICQALNIPLEIIEGTREAELTYRGACYDLSPQPKSRLVIDIGGGSTEIITGKGKDIERTTSLNLGGVKLTDLCSLTYPVAPENAQAAQRYIDKVLDEAAWLWNQDFEEVVAVSGTPTSLAALELGGFDADRVQGYQLSLQTILNWKQTFARSSLEEVRDRYQLGKSSDIIYAGTSILQNILERLGNSSLTVSTKGVRYGVALQLFN